MAKERSELRGACAQHHDESVPRDLRRARHRGVQERAAGDPNELLGRSEAGRSTRRQQHGIETVTRAAAALGCGHG